MKKILAILLTFAVIGLSLCGCNKDTNVDSQKKPLSETNSAYQENAETLSEKLIREIDGVYLEEQKKPEYTTTIGMIELAEQYTKKWKQVADKYFSEIMNYNGATSLYETTDDLHSSVSDMKSKWEKSSKEQYANYVKTLETTYKGGTIIGPIAANYKYQLQKEWALQLIGIYEELDVK